jgi:hypothetical protein
MESVSIGLSAFVVSQLVCLFGTLVVLGALIHHEYHKGNDLTYREFLSLLFTCVVFGSLGFFMPLVMWAIYQVATNEGSDLSGRQPNSIYPVVAHERILLRGSASGKTFRALTDDWET